MTRYLPEIAGTLMRFTYRRYRYLCTGLTALADHWQIPGE